MEQIKSGDSTSMVTAPPTRSEGQKEGRRYPAETGGEGYTLSERTLGQWLEHWATVTPDKEYIVYSDRDLRFTWSKFNERVDNLAKGLLAIGVTKGSNVGIWATNVPDWLTFLYARPK